MKNIKKYKIDILITILLLFISIFFIFAKLGLNELHDWDEGIYANIAGEMVQKKDFLHLKLQNVDWFEKEPFPFWLEAVSIKIFGNTTFALRFPAALLSILIAPLVFLISRYWMNKIYSTLSALIFLFSPILWKSHMLQTADFDILSLSFFLLSFVSYIYLRDKKIWWISPVFLSIGIISRGVLGIFHIIIIFLAEISRPIFKLKKWDTKKILTFLLISILPWLCWHLFLLITVGQEYINIYWKEQFFSRITDPLQGHQGTILYYFNFLKETIGLKYLLIFLFSTILLNFNIFFKKEWKSLFLLLWFLVTIVPQHIIQTKLYWYITPAIPVMYIISTYGLYTMLTKIQNRYKIYIDLLLILFLGINVLTLSQNVSNKIKDKKYTNLQNFIELNSQKLKTTPNKESPRQASGYFFFIQYYVSNRVS